jgi:hypothetical protein
LHFLTKYCSTSACPERSRKAQSKIFAAARLCAVQLATSIGSRARNDSWQLLPLVLTSRVIAINSMVKKQNEPS